MPLAHQKNKTKQNGNLILKVKVTESLTAVSFERVSRVEYACQIMSLFLTVQKLWPRIKFSKKVTENEFNPES